EDQLHWTPTAEQPHANVAFAPRSPATFQIEPGNFVINQQTTISVNLTERCGFVSSSAAHTAFVGTFAGASASAATQSGTFAMKVQGSTSTASASLRKVSGAEKAAAVATATAALLVGGNTVTVTGSYDSGSKAVTLSGNGYSFTGSIQSGVYSGS